TEPSGGPGEEELLPGPGHAHVAEAALLLEVLGLALHAPVGKKPFLQPHQKNRPEFKALGGVEGQEAYPGGRGPVLLLAGVEREAIQVGAEVGPGALPALELLERAQDAFHPLEPAVDGAGRGGAGAGGGLEADLPEERAGDGGKGLGPEPGPSPPDQRG